MQAQAFLTRFREFLRDDDGGIAIEAAIIFPVGFFLVLGTLEMALYFFTNSALNNAVKEMAYYAAQECKASEKGGDNSSVSCVAKDSYRDKKNLQGELEEKLRTYSGNLIKLDPNNLCIRVESVAPAGLKNNLGGSYQIMRYDFSYKWTFFTPLIGKFFNKDGKVQFDASFLVRNGEITDPSRRDFDWMNDCSNFANVQ